MYIKEAKKLIKELFYEDWMNEEDWRECEELILKTANLSYQILSDQIAAGVKNGHSVKKQIILLKHAISKL